VLLRGTTYEVSTTGFDENLQLIGGDPFGSAYNLGLRIPSTATPDANHRYLFMLARARFNARQRARMTGIRQLLTIGVSVPETAESGANVQNYILEEMVINPFWHFQDGNVSWHLLKMPIMSTVLSNPNNADCFMFRDSQTPALLYEAFTPPFLGGGGPIVAYAPPYGGRPLYTENPLIPDYGCWRDLRFPWTSTMGTFPIPDIEFEGPCDIALYASVRQTNPSTRAALTIPASPAAGTNSIPFEDAMVANFANTIYWRIAGSLAFDVEDFYPRRMVEEEGRRK
jgi:hypothetical protein